MSESTTLDKAAIRAMLKQNRGSFTLVAAEIGIAQPTLSLWLQGRFVSQDLEEAVPAAIKKLKLKPRRRAAA